LRGPTEGRNTVTKFSPAAIRNVALISHRGAGKTSLAELLLFASGAIEKLGSVESGDTVCDFEAEEIKRKITIFPSLCYLEHRDTKVNLVDTPGYSDFIAMVEGALKVTEAAVLVLDAVSGVEVETERVWNLVRRAELPVIIFVNKLEKENANFSQTLEQIRKTLTKDALPFCLPIGEGVQFKGIVDVMAGKAFLPGSKGKETPAEVPAEMGASAQEAKGGIIERAAEATDELTEKYLEEGTLTDEEIQEGIRASILSRKLFPVIVGSALSGVGATLLLDTIVNHLPSPLEIKAKIKQLDSDEEREVEPDPKGQCTAFICRTIVDPYIGRLSLLRVFCGTIAADMQLFVAGNEAKERISQPLLVRGKNQQPVEIIGPGDMGAIGRLAVAKTFDTLHSESPVKVPPPFIPVPVFSMAVMPGGRADEDKLAAALARIEDEDPCFAHHRDQETGEIIISGGGQLHLEIIIDRLRDRYNVSVTVGSPKVAFRETISKTSDAQGRYKKQTGGRGQYGDVFVRLEPLPRGAGFEFAQEIKGGEVPSQYFPAVEKGIIEAKEKGILARYPVVDFKAILYKGSFHPVDSSELAFKIAASMAFKAAMEKAGPVLLEPLMEIEVVVPADNVGDVIGDLNARRARVSSVEPGPSVQTVRALAPVSEMLTFPTELRSMTQGRASMTVSFSHYETAPSQVAEVIISRRKQGEEG
jgi:elongation factor G